MRSHLGLAASLALIVAMAHIAPVHAQNAAPHTTPSARILIGPNNQPTLPVRKLSGRVCDDPRVRATARNTLNPITGVSSGTVIAVPLAKGPVDLKNATTRAQIARACAQAQH